MKKKLIPLILALVCALCCAFSLTACSVKNTSKVKDETQWKQAIADARNSDKTIFTAEINKDSLTAEIIIKVAGNAQYLKMSATGSETWEYYYDGDYVYLNVTDQQLGYTWQKIDASTATDEFPEPKSSINKIYSGELMREMFELELNFDGLDELSNRYADAQYGFDSEKYGADTYVIIDGDTSADGIVYTLTFYLDINYLRLNIVSQGWNLSHRMGDDYNYSVEVNIPTESVQAAGAEN